METGWCITWAQVFCVRFLPANNFLYLDALCINKSLLLFLAYLSVWRSCLWSSQWSLTWKLSFPQSFLPFVSHVDFLVFHLAPHRCHKPSHKGKKITLFIQNRTHEPNTVPYNLTEPDIPPTSSGGPMARAPHHQTTCKHKRLSPSTHTH